MQEGGGQGWRRGQGAGRAETQQEKGGGSGVSAEKAGKIKGPDNPTCEDYLFVKSAEVNRSD